MKLESVRKLWTDKNIGGSIDVSNGKRMLSGEIRGKRDILVTFSPNGKQYTYKTTLVEFAARFDLIPQIDVIVESRNAVRAIENGETPMVHSECSDTIIAMWNNRNDTTVKFTDDSPDDYDRQMILCKVINRADDPWLN